MSMIKEDLPAAFRITGHRALAECVLNCLETKYFKQLCEVEVDGEKIPPPHSLPWYGMSMLVKKLIVIVL